ncbi:plasmid mobilization protein [Hymenobacter sp. B81]|uniref:plasmid mobilization protein n=1 Tax=Hymenobacter sp. B81 TaxID=3344878 RepID=UPI0037DBFE2E
MTNETEPTAKEPLRDKMIPVRVSEDEKKAIELKASLAGYKSVSAYLRDVGQGTELTQKLTPEVRRQLVGIGNNLNQIARLANSGKPFHSHEVQLKQALTLILELLA